jgi:hypothetical protein
MVAEADFLLSKEAIRAKYPGGSPDYPTHHKTCGCSGCNASWTEWRGGHAAAQAMTTAIVKFGRAYVQKKLDSGFSTAHLANFLDAIERGEHVSDEPSPAEAAAR